MWCAYVQLIFMSFESVLPAAIAAVGYEVCAFVCICVRLRWQEAIIAAAVSFSECIRAVLCDKNSLDECNAHATGVADL